MLSIILFDKVLQDAAGFEKADFFAGQNICDCRDAAIRVYLREPRLFLFVGEDVGLVDFVKETELFQGNRDLDAIRNLISIQVDIRGLCA